MNAISNLQMFIHIQCHYTVHMYTYSFEERGALSYHRCQWCSTITSMHDHIYGLMNILWAMNVGWTAMCSSDSGGQYEELQSQLSMLRWARLPQLVRLRAKLQWWIQKELGVSRKYTDFSVVWGTNYRQKILSMLLFEWSLSLRSTLISMFECSEPAVLESSCC